MRRRAPRPRAIVRASVLATACVAAAAATMAQGATSTTVVSMSVPSAISITNGCTGTPATAFGTVQPGTGATTATGAGICNVSWTSSNDSSMLRIAQRDGTGTAMTRQATGNNTVGWTFFTSLDTIDGTTAVAGGSGGTLGRTTNSGGTWSTVGNIGGLGSEVADVELVPSDATIAWLVGYGGRVHRVSNLAGAWATSNRIGNLIAQGWPAGGDVTSIAVLDDSTVYLGGFNGYLAKTVNGGTNWTVYQLASTGTVYSLETSPTGHVWAATSGNSSGNLWRATTATADDPTDWTRYNVGGGNAGFRDVSVPDGTHGYAVGPAGVLWSWDGATWTWRGDADLESRDLYSVTSSPATPDVAVATGEYGSILRTATSGSSWSRISSPTNEGIGAVRAGTGGIVATGGARHGISSSDGGLSWTWQSENATGQSRWGSAIDPVDGKLGLHVGSRGTIWRTTDSGATWNTVVSGTTEPLFDVTFESTQVAWAVGSNGTVLRSGDGGLTWSPRTSGTTVRLTRVSSGDVGSIVATGDGGTVVRSGNGGTSFTVSNPTTNYIRDVSMGSRTVGVMGGTGFIRRTTDGGATWTLATSTPASADVLSIHMVDDTTGYAGTSWQGLWKTTDGGANWSLVASHPSNGYITALDSANASRIYTTINKTVYRSTDAGATWASHFTTVTDLNSFDVGDDFAILGGGNSGASYFKQGSSVVGTAVPNYGAAPNSWAPSAESMFGVCMQGVGGTATPTAPFTDDANTCTASDADVWQPVTTSPVKVASATASSGSVDLVFGVRFAANQAPGTYSAGIVFEALAPNV